MVVGYASGTEGYQAFRWTEQNGTTGLGDLPDGEFNSKARDVSQDGSVVVGVAASKNGLEPFIWTAAGGMKALGAGLKNAAAEAVSSDGKVLAGNCSPLSGVGNEAFAWSKSGGLVRLGDFEGGSTYSMAYDISGDGRLVVGSGTTAKGTEAALWDLATGRRYNVNRLLTNSAVAAGWTLRSCTGISRDGRSICGFGTDPQGRPQAFVLLDFDLSVLAPTVAMTVDAQNKIQVHFTGTLEESIDLVTWIDSTVVKSPKVIDALVTPVFFRAAIE